MDNVKIHVADILISLRFALNFFSAAQYSPFLNPIEEEYFGLQKHYFRKNLK